MNPILVILLIVVFFVAFVLVVALLNSVILLSAGRSYTQKQRKREVEAVRSCLPGTDCGDCGCESCAAFAERLENEAGLDACPHWMEEQKAAALAVMQGRREDMDRISRRANEARQKDKKSILRRWHARRTGKWNQE